MLLAAQKWRTISLPCLASSISLAFLDTDLGPVEAGVAVLVHGKQGCVDVIPVLVSRDQKRADILSIDFPVNTVAEKVVK